MNIAFAGAEYIVNIHAQAAQAQNAQRVALAAVVEKHSNKSAALAKKFHIKFQYETIAKLKKFLESEDIKPIGYRDLRNAMRSN